MSLLFKDVVMSILFKECNNVLTIQGVIMSLLFKDVVMSLLFKKCSHVLTIQGM